MTDFRALCAELTEFVARLTKHYYQPAELLTRARAALAAEPVAEVPTYDDLCELCSEHGLDVDIWPLEKFDALWEVARAVLARWGRPAPVPVEGEVAELVAWLLDEATQAAYANRSIAAKKLTWAAQIVGEYAELEGGND